MLTIYDSNGNRRTDIEAGDSSTQVKEVQGDNVLTLSFTHYEYIALDVNDRVDFEGERYWLTERYTPKQKSGQEWVYDLKFYGIESLVRRFLVLETTDGNTEPVFTLTATPREHVAMIVKCINDGMNHTTDWKVGRVDGTDLIVIDYEGKYCNEALKEIAEAVGGQAEWWVEGQTVNVCRCEHGEEITLGYGKGLTGIERDTTGTDNFYTRLFPVGSTRNIDPSKYGHSRLMLPGGRQYVEIHTEEYGIYDRYEQDAFSGIYPRRIGAVSSVRSEDVKDDDGNPFTVYYFRDDSLNFDPNDYELPDETKRVSFQDGDLSGLGQGEDHYFEVNFNSATREFEIITIWPYDDDTQLPGGKLIPKSDDHYILWNIRMPDEYYPLAEEEFLTAVEQFNTECWQDLAVYKAPTDHVWIEENGVSLSVGRRVRLESEEYFPETGYRSSRITKITRKVNQPGEMDIEISDALHSGAFERVNDSIGELKNYTKSKAEGAALPDIIRSWDKTLPTDNNLFSARRSQAEHISKKKNDRAKGKITFEAGASFGQEDNAGIDDKGNAELLTLVVKTLLRSPKFVDGLFGEGWRLWIEDALSHLTIDKLTVRQVMVVLELLIEKVRSVGGQLCVSAANGKIKTAVLEDGYWKITFEQDNTFAAHDLMRCQTFTGGNLKGYWVEVAGVEGDSILVPEGEFGASHPEAGDECVLMGNTENPLRQNLILISATEDGQPRVDVMDGVKAKNFSGCLRARLGNLDGISDDWFPADNQPHGNGLYSDNAYLRGTFLLVTGEDIKTKFEIVEGRITSAVTALRNDFATEKGYLNNPAFDDGLEKWNTENETVFFLAGNRWIWANNNVLARKGDGASVTVDDGRTVVRIRNKYILQKRANLKSIPSMPVNGDGEKEAVPVYLSFFYRCAKAGTLRVEFLDVDKTGFANFNSMEVEEEIDVTDGYVQYTCNGLWNGTGDFKLSFTGDIYLYMLVLSADKVESLAHRYRTLFEQSERLVKISAAVFDRDENLLQETGLFVKPEGSGLYAQGTDGKVALVGVAVEETDADGNSRTVIKLTADNILLEGLVTANENFKILEDGSIEARNGKFTGEIDATGGTVGGFDISSSSLQAVSGAESMYLSAGLMRFMNRENSVFLGSDVIPSSMGGMISCPMRVEVSRTSDSILYGNIGLYLDVTGSNAYDDQGYQYSGNHALYIPHGDICGLRLRVRRVNTSQTLSDMDSFIITVGSSDITLTLPSSPQDGQAYWFKQSASGAYTLTVGDSSHRINDGRTNSKSSWKVSDGCIVMLVWDKVNKQWCAGYSDYN
ncbi:hypothetical protein [Bacteroides xylanisolvens]|uniref:hypothetical protein n=1 Tax=Bacteroides xylanisolvens TaxID=371601 RepID=UPI0021648E59|nr:hypothetical protein [Bacteroides xylanisolvens]UVQ11627.1 hypothetical protein NXW81_02540 [Bacteroides xylanisolvens]